MPKTTRTHSDRQTHANSNPTNHTRTGNGRAASAPTGKDTEAPTTSTCDQPLAVGEVVEEFNFGQFVNLVVVDGEITLPVLVSDDAPTQIYKTPVANAGATFHGLLHGKVEMRKLPERVMVADLDHMLATGKVKVGTGSATVELSPPVIRELIAGRATKATAEVHGRSQPIELVPPAHDVPVPAAEVAGHVIHDLPSFLANPRVRGPDGAVQPIALSAEAIRTLRAGATAVVPNGSQTIAFKAEAMIARESPADMARVGGATPVSISKDVRIRDLQIYQPDPSPAAGMQLSVFLPWIQRWTLQGYGRGRLVHSLCLGPGEETTIEVFSWDRIKKSLEQTATTDAEQSAEQSETDRDTLDVYTELTKTNELQWHVGGSLDFVYQGGMASLTAKAEGGVANKSNLGSVAKTTQNQLHEGVKKASARVRVQRSTKITESIERGTEERVTRKVKNPNLCHTLTFDYYDVRARYLITTTFRDQDVHLCVMIKNPIDLPNGFTYDAIREYEGALRPALLDRDLLDGFAACRLLRAREFAVALLEAQRIKQAAAGQSAGGSGGGSSSTTSTPTPEQIRATAILTKMRDAWLTVVTTAGSSVIDYVDAIKAGNVPASDTTLAAQLYLFHQLMIKYYGGLTNFLGNLPPTGNVDVVDWGARLQPFVPQATQQPAINAFDGLEDTKKEDVIADLIWSVGGLWSHASGEYRRYGGYHAEDEGLAALLQLFTPAYQAFLDAQPGASSTGVGATKEDTAKALAEQEARDEADRLEMAYGLKDTAEASERAEDLKKHLEDHKDYYRYAIFQASPPSEQLQALSEQGLGSGLPPGAFEPRVVGYRGGLLAVPLNIGLLRGAKKILDSLVQQVMAGQTNLHDEITLPVGGMSIETRLGRCSGCEPFVEQLRRAEIRDRAARAEQQELEGRRYRARLDAKHPLLGDPQIEESPLVIRQEKTDAVPSA